MLPDEPPRPPEGEDAASLPAERTQPPASEGPGGSGNRRRRSRRGGRRHRERDGGAGPGYRGMDAAPSARGDEPHGLGPESDDYDPPPLPGDASGPARAEGRPSLLDPGALAAGSESEQEGARRRRRRGGRRRSGREDGGPAQPTDGALPGGIGPEADEGPPPLEGAPPPDRPSAPAEERRPRREREREGRRPRRDERMRQRRERGPVRRPRDEAELVEVHEAGLPAPEEGEEVAATSGAPVLKTLLINAADPEEVRIALLEDGKLEEIYLETGHERSAAGNIYRGRVQNVERGIGAAFVDLGRGIMGFLHVSDLPDRPEGKEEASVTELLEPGQEVLVQITRDSIGRKGPALTGRISLPGRYLVLTPNSDRTGVSRRIGHAGERDRVRQLLRDLEVAEGMGVIVRTAGESQPLALLKADLVHLMAEWEALKVKAAEAGIPGLLRGESDVAERCVRDIMPADVSRVLVDDARMAERLRLLLDVWYPQVVPGETVTAAAEIPAVAGAPEAVSAPPSGGDVSVEAPLESSPARVQAPAAIAAPRAVPARSVEHDEFGAGLLSAGQAPAAGAVPTLEPEPDFDPPPLDDTVTEPVTEPVEELEPAPPAAPQAASAPTTPEVLPAPPQVELWTDPMPLFHAQGVETQLEDALRRTSRLPSGGSIVIDPTEALVAIDVNSGRLTDEEDPERTALVTNLEAVAEVTRQLRLRDLGGLIVIDFIDMRDKKAVRKVERELRRALVRDRARIRVDRIGPFGCVMLSRQRIRQALQRVTHEECSICSGTGRRRLVSGLSLRVLREVQARVARSRGRGGLEVRVPPPVSDWLKKHRSTALRDLRQVCTGPIRIEADARLASDGWAMRGLPPGGEGPVASARL